VAEDKLQVTNASTQLLRTLQRKVQTRVTLKVNFRIKDENLPLVKIVTDMQEYDCTIEVPHLISSLYGFALTMNKHDSTDQNSPPFQSNVD